MKVFIRNTQRTYFQMLKPFWGTFPSGEWRDEPATGRNVYDI